MDQALLVELLVGAALWGCIPGFIATRKGRDFVPWWLYGGLVFPIALIHILYLPTAGSVKCPFCAEMVKAEATVCKHCRKDLPTRAPAPTGGPSNFKSREEYQRWKAKQVVVLAVLLAASPACADRIHLKTGEYVDVDAWRESGGQIYYSRFGGEIGIDKGDIIRIEKRQTDPSSWQAPGSPKNAAAPTTDDAARPQPQPETSTPAPSGTPPAAATKAMLVDYWARQKAESLEGMRQAAIALETCRTTFCTEAATTRHLRWTQRWMQATREYDAAIR